MLGAQGDADARRHLQPQAVHVDRVDQAALERGPHHLGRAHVVAAEHLAHGEFVGPQPGEEGVAAGRAGVDRLLEAPRHLDEHDVARGVAERVVDLAEAVDPGHQHGDGAAGRGIEGGRQALRVVHPVGQAGQGVVERVVGPLAGLVVEALDQPPVLEGHAGRVGERGERLGVVVVEGRDVARAVGHREHADELAVGHERREHGVLGAQLEEQPHQHRVARRRAAPARPGGRWPRRPPPRGGTSAAHVHAAGSGPGVWVARRSGSSSGPVNSVISAHSPRSSSQVCTSMASNTASGSRVSFTRRVNSNRAVSRSKRWRSATDPR